MDERLSNQERLTETIELGESHFREFKSAHAGRPGNKKPLGFKELMRKVAEE